MYEYNQKYYYASSINKGVGRKFSGGRGQRKKDRKLAKKYRKIALFASSRGGGDRKIAKQGRKIALLSLYLLYLYHV